MYASGKIQNFESSPVPTDPDLLIGYEFSGICNGKRIMGILEFGAISLEVEIDPLYTWEVPIKWTLEDASTVPVQYAMVI